MSLRSALGASILVLILGAATVVIAEIPQMMNCQGILLNSEGNPITESTGVIFSIWNQAVDGDSLWSELREIVPDDQGRFDIILGGTPIPEAVFAAPDRWLGITVAHDPFEEMVPRQQLVSVAYAYRVITVDGATGGTITSKVTIGATNSNDGADAFVTGANNHAWGDYSVVGGGGPRVADSNSALGDFSVVNGGQCNTALDHFAAIGGGFSNSADEYAAVGGGYFNSAQFQATVGGGTHNEASGLISTVGGGGYNKARGLLSVIAGGGGTVATDSNWATGSNSSIIGGAGNHAAGHMSVVAGGHKNRALDSAAVVGGVDNDAFGALSFVGGGRYNNAVADSSTICGGTDNYAGGVGSVIVGGTDNQTNADNSTIAGGEGNFTGGIHSAIGGGLDNDAGGNYSAIAGGRLNDISGGLSCVPGGYQCHIDSDYSMAFGYQVYVNVNKRVVFFDGVQSGGLRLNRDSYEGTSSYPIHVGTNTGNGNGAYLTTGGTWVNGSSRTFKEDFTPLVRDELLEKIAGLQIDSWRYRNSPERHIGPVAEEFVAAFDVGTIDDNGSRDNRYLSSVDVAGVALAAVQELHKRTKKIKKLEAENEAIKARLARLEALLQEMQTR